jgi:hypothetical protein
VRVADSLIDFGSSRGAEEKSGSENFFIDKGEWHVDKLSGKLIETEMPHGPVAANHRLEKA